MPKKISENKMSELLGHSSGYIRGISSGRALPSMQEFFYICDFLGVTPQQFFDAGQANPAKIQAIADGLASLDAENLDLVASLVKALKK